MERLAMSSQQVSSPPATGAEVERLRSRVRELEKEREWSKKQHELWSNERLAMLRKLRELRAGEIESKYLVPVIEWAEEWRDRFSGKGRGGHKGRAGNKEG
jgi:hypothetical protein